MATEAPETDRWLAGVKRGNSAALAALFEYYAPRLRKMLRLRMGPGLVARIDVSDVLQEAYIDVARKVVDYVRQPKVAFYIWLRGVVEERMIMLQRRHLGAKCRAVTREVALPAGSSVLLGRQLLARASSPSQRLLKEEIAQRVQQALARLADEDREVLLMRHFEEMSNGEIAEALGIGESGATMRYGRALRRLKDILKETLTSSEAKP